MSPHVTATRAARERLQLGHVAIDRVGFDQALDAIEQLVRARRGGTVLTPNVDHVVLAETDARLRAAYESASLSLVDGTPVLWASRLLGAPCPEKVSGSDLIEPLLARAEACGFSVYLLGGEPGVAEKAALTIGVRWPLLRVCGWDAPRVDLDEQSGHTQHEIVQKIRAAKPDLVLVALGCPKQEILMQRVRDAVRPAVLLGLGASLDFLAGTVPRAPRVVSQLGLEWLYRLAHEPRRLWRRYLVRDPKFLVVLMRALRLRA